MTYTVSSGTLNLAQPSTISYSVQQRSDGLTQCRAHNSCRPGRIILEVIEVPKRRQLMRDNEAQSFNPISRDEPSHEGD